MVTPAAGPAGSIVPNASMTTILAGESGKPFKILTDLLTSRSPYFRELFGTPARRHSMTNFPITRELPEASDATLAFPELNEFAFALFNMWLYGGQLSGPSNCHTVQHYLGLYVLATRFQIEKLENEVMDLIRAYHRGSNSSCPPYRLEYIYENTSGPNKMREFLVSATAYHIVAEGSMTNVMRNVLGHGGELTMDFVDSLIKVKTGESVGVWKEKDCAWHKHIETRPCQRSGSEE
ncbi:uncharacterized protein PV09_01666 [Verruconis gallopava]|uniref:BTB domain-containing protein n=1 Tax=Verruconis gallopava TaxID=253628 RepID=A0A0D1XY42_9PEZI|nr:uncharacterized protein PV09_01666 [Verruconis gallopava]KIW07736.1 hypothetical protein PV09_01666 [Verruconis gallopava]